MSIKTFSNSATSKTVNRPGIRRGLRFMHRARGMHTCYFHEALRQMWPSTMSTNSVGRPISKPTHFISSVFLSFICTVIGGWVNSRVLIRRKKSDPNQVLQQVFVNSVLSSQTATKFVIEVTNSECFQC